MTRMTVGAVVALIILLTACRPAAHDYSAAPKPRPITGRVVGTETTKGPTPPYLMVKDGRGTVTVLPVTKQTLKRCPMKARYPSCKNG